MIWLILPVALIVSYLLTASVYKYALATQHLDLPNARSSHTVPTPRGGGLGIVIACALGVAGLWLADMIDQAMLLAIGFGGLMIAMVGYLDDRGSLSVKFRMLVHVVAAMLAIYVLGGIPKIQVGATVHDLGWFGDLLGAIAIVWALNLFNFMDGIDGIAASEAIFVAVGAAGLTYATTTPDSVTLVALLLGSACLGFLAWNWPPAKIFMGDVGSGYIGYVIAVLAVADARENLAALFVWLTLGGVFFVDATLTLIRRLLRGERVYEAHRSHAYQSLSRRWASHKRVTVLSILINVLWLLPMAWLCTCYPSSAWLICIFALTPLAILAFIAGAGRPE